MLSTGAVKSVTERLRGFERGRSQRERVTLGITLIELLVVIGIVGLLASLSLPAVMQARESARRSQCQSSLRQLGIAAQGHISANGVLPPGMYSYGVDKRYLTFFAPQSRMLPYLESSNTIFNAINFEAEAGDFAGTRPGAWAPCNATAAGVRLAMFLCPSEVQREARNSFRANTGPHPFAGTSKLEAIKYGRAYGPFTPFDAALRTSDFQDGLSMTVLFAERVAGDEMPATFSPFLDLADATGLKPGLSVDEYAALCEFRGDPGSNHRSDLGRSWLYTSVHTIYGHSLAPNARIPDCGHVYGPPLIAAITARSYHRGGVNVVFADAHAQFISSEISLRVWRLLGGRNDGEPIDAF